MSARKLAASLTLLLLAAAPRSAWAFCNVMTCDAGDVTQHCKIDSKTQCVTSGLPVFWSSTCVTFSIQKDAAPHVGIDYAAAAASLKRAFHSWSSADCDGKPPSLHFELSEPVTCSASEYNSPGQNANILIFREDEWPYEGGEDALGLTRIRFDPEGNIGELWDTDIEINAVTEPLSLGEPSDDEVDLDSLMTHEVGHALGLNHSLDVDATMIAGYVKGSIGLRSLGADDVSGVCSIYPPGRESSSSSCDTRHGFSELCGSEQPPPSPTVSQATNSCSVAVTGQDSNPTGRALGLLLASACSAALCWRRKRPRSAQISTVARDSV